MVFGETFGEIISIEIKILCFRFGIGRRCTITGEKVIRHGRHRKMTKRKIDPDLFSFGKGTDISRKTFDEMVGDFVSIVIGH